MFKLASIGLLAIGTFIFMQGVLPLVSFKLWEVTNLSGKAPLISPIAGGRVLGVSVQEDQNFPFFISTIKRVGKAPYESFTVSVPKLNINQAKVKVDNNEAETHLSHLPGTALPGERGNVFISGHSNLFKPELKDKTYLNIFKDLQKLDKGDAIQVFVGGQVFTYKVKGILVVDPKNLSVISPPDDTGRYLSLMTCVPPGTYLKRLVVLSELQ